MSWALPSRNAGMVRSPILLIVVPLCQWSLLGSATERLAFDPSWFAPLMETIGTRCINMNAITPTQVFPPSRYQCPPPTKPRRHPGLCALGHHRLLAR
jgi:hypothetical protein